MSRASAAPGTKQPRRTGRKPREQPGGHSAQGRQGMRWVGEAGDGVNAPGGASGARRRRPPPRQLRAGRQAHNKPPHAPSDCSPRARGRRRPPARHCHTLCAMLTRGGTATWPARGGSRRPPARPTRQIRHDGLPHCTRQPRRARAARSAGPLAAAPGTRTAGCSYDHGLVAGKVGSRGARRAAAAARAGQAGPAQLTSSGARVRLSDARGRP